MAARIDQLIEAYEKVVKEPWSSALSGQERIWFLVYDPAEQRKVDLRLGDFEELKNISSKSSNEKILNYNGIRGQKEIINSSTSFPFLKSNSEELDPSIYIERYQKAKKLFLEEALN
jgi:hypothetical protein